MSRILQIVATCCIVTASAGGQGTPPPVILQIDVQNQVQYRGDVADPSRLATNPNATPGVPPRNFEEYQTIGDIVNVNGQQALGTLLSNGRAFNLSTTAQPGQAIADTVRTTTALTSFEFLRPDGVPIGSVFVAGAGGGAPPPGAPSSVTQAANAIIGGTGAFLGVRGQSGTTVAPGLTTAPRSASMAEDPANRRLNGGSRTRYVLHLIPMSRPEIMSVLHSDFTPVTANNPAKANEILIIKSAGLGPTRPSLNPGEPFPADRILEVNSPLEVSVNRRSAEVINAIGWPGLLDNYRVDFRLPDGLSAPTAAIQLTAAWISGSEVRIPVQ